MDVYGIQIPDKALTNFELLDYVHKLKISNFRGVFMWELSLHHLEKMNVKLSSLTLLSNLEVTGFVTTKREGKEYTSILSDKFHYKIRSRGKGEISSSKR